MKELDCPNCGKTVPIAEQSALQAIQCVHCGATLNVPPAVRPAGQPMKVAHRILVLAATCIILSTAAGALVDAISVRISPAFFHFALPNIVDIQPAAIAFGISIGFLWGVFFAFVYTGVVYIVSRGKFELPQALQTILVYSLLAPVGYVCGGLAGVGLAALSPEFYQRVFMPGLSLGYEEIIWFSWAGGGFCGVVGGGLLAVILASASHAEHWRKQHPA